MTMNSMATEINVLGYATIYDKVSVVNLGNAVGRHTMEIATREQKLFLVSNDDRSYAHQIQTHQQMMPVLRVYTMSVRIGPFILQEAQHRTHI